MFLGMSRGSVGDVTFYRGRGQQLARARNRNPKNPRSSAQIIQRMILATASKAYSRLQSIVNHSFQGVTYGGESQSFFLSKAMDRIRNYVAASLEMYPASITDPSEYVGLAMPNDLHESGIGLLVSMGTIPSVSPNIQSKTEGGETIQFVAGFGPVMTIDELVGVPKVNQVLTAFNAQVGDQITAIALIDGVLHRSRYIIDTNASAAALEAGWEGDGSSAAFDANKTEIDDLLILGWNDSVKVMSLYSEKEISAGAVIVSREVNGTWQRSTQYLVPMSQDGVGQNVQGIIDLWSLGTTPVGVDSPYYLNNADD